MRRKGGFETMWQTLPEEGNDPELRMFMAESRKDDALPALIVIHEAFGVDQHIREITQRFADEGFVAVAPDLFSVDPFGKTLSTDEITDAFRLRMAVPAERRGDPTAVEEQLAKLPEEDAARKREILAWMGRRDMGRLVPPLVRVVDWCRNQDNVTGKVGVVGFCFGGGMTSRLAASGAEIDAGAPFYGQAPPLDRVPNIRCPLLFMYGRKDPFIMPGVPDLLKAVEDAKLTYGLHIYDDAGHAFMNDRRPEMHQAAAAREAWPLTIDFFRRYLGS